MSLAFQEKSLWLLGMGLLVSFGLYFGSVLPAEAMDVLPHQIVRFCAFIVLLVVFQVAGHILLAVAERSRRPGPLHQTDERDRIIHLKGTRNASYVLATGVFVSICLALFTEGNFLFTHALLALWVLAQLVEIGSQLVFYRRGS